MNADIVGALEQLDKSWKAFEHKEKSMTKEQVRKVLVYGIKKGYTHTGQLTDEEVDSVLSEALPTIEGKSASRVMKGYEKYPKDWKAQYDMLLMDGVTCGDCVHSSRCKTIFGGNDKNTSCQFYPNRFQNKD